MATDERFDESISRWLEETAPLRLPGRVLDATFERTRRSRQQVGWRALLGRTRVTRSVFALGGAVVVVMAAALAFDFYADQPAVGGPDATADPRSSFLGTWFSTSDADGGTQTMTIRASGDGAVEIVVTDDVASVCSLGPSTMTGTGRLEGSTQLIIPAPVYTCDDGSEPQALIGPPLEEQLRNLTYVHDPRTNVLTVGPGSVWTRIRGEVPSPQPTISGTMWPQSSLEEVRHAQQLADAGDPAYTWQVDPQLASEEGWGHLNDLRAEIVKRFLREELGWEEFVFDVFQEQLGPVDSSGAGGFHRGVVFLRCAPGETNPLYPVGTDQLPAARCAPQACTRCHRCGCQRRPGQRIVRLLVERLPRDLCRRDRLTVGLQRESVRGLNLPITRELRDGCCCRFQRRTAVNAAVIVRITAVDQRPRQQRQRRAIIRLGGDKLARYRNRRVEIAAIKGVLRAA